jgi:hypothetical protein
MANTWLIEWRIRSNRSLSLVLGRVIIGASVPVVVLAGPDDMDGAAAVTGTNPSWGNGKRRSYAAFLGLAHGHYPSVVVLAVVRVPTGR